MTPLTPDSIAALRAELDSALVAAAKDAAALEQLEQRYLGRRGTLTLYLRQIAEMTEEQRRDIGGALNALKAEFQRQLANAAAAANAAPAAFVDVTLPGGASERGHRHPVTLLSSELEDLFRSLGFLVLDGPELESDYFNFEALNIPAYHPARDMQDTFYLDPASAQPPRSGEPSWVMRTQTSPVQIRAMRRFGAPIRCIVPGRVFRNEATDAAHDTTFFQIEGLVVDEGISVANLIAILRTMLESIFRHEITLRIRPGYFPFVEPGLEVDVKCTICGGGGCPACKHGGWLEMVGAGMVHPNVLRAGGVDPARYSGFAFGLGLTRLAMMRYGIDDIRLMNSGDLRFLKQF